MKTKTKNQPQKKPQTKLQGISSSFEKIIPAIYMPGYSLIITSTCSYPVPTTKIPVGVFELTPGSKVTFLTERPPRVVGVKIGNWKFIPTGKDLDQYDEHMSAARWRFVQEKFPGISKKLFI